MFSGVMSLDLTSKKVGGTAAGLWASSATSGASSKARASAWIASTRLGSGALVYSRLHGAGHHSAGVSVECEAEG